jgi:Response regulator receiver domain
MDIRMPKVDGIVATATVRRRPKPPEVLVLTTFDTDDHVVHALRAGASGFLLKDTPPAKIVAAIHAVASGEPVMSPQLMRRLLDRVAVETGQHQKNSASGAQRPRDGGRAGRRWRPIQRRNCRGAVHERGDRQGPHQQHPQQAGLGQPHTDCSASPRRRVVLKRKVSARCAKSRDVDLLRPAGHSPGSRTRLDGAAN